MKALTFNYMYRDGANWKSFGDVTFRIDDMHGMSNDEYAQWFEDQMVEINGGDMLFIASEVDIPEVFVWTGNEMEDHCWHEFVDVDIHDADSNVYISDERTVSELLDDFRKAPRREFWPGRVYA